MAERGARVAQKEQFQPVLVFASASLAAEGIITKLAKPELVRPHKDLVEGREPRRRRYVELAKRAAKAVKRLGWRGKATGEEHEGKKPELTVIEKKVEIKPIYSEVRAEAKKAAAPVRRAEIGDARLRELVSSGIEGLGAGQDIVVCGDNGEVYFFHASTPELAMLLRDSASALTFLGKRLGQFVEAITVNGIVYVVTMREGVEASTDSRIIRREIRRARKYGKAWKTKNTELKSDAA